jgi:hypothetical protein
VRLAVASNAGASGLATQNNDGSTWYSKTGNTVILSFTNNNAFTAVTLNSLDVAANLYYFAASASTGSSQSVANRYTFSNSLYDATLTLSSAGVLTYDLQPAVSQVPLPASVWLMGAGLAGIGGVIRRRKADVAAQV